MKKSIALKKSTPKHLCIKLKIKKKEKIPHLIFMANK